MKFNCLKLFHYKRKRFVLLFSVLTIVVYFGYPGELNPQLTVHKPKALNKTEFKTALCYAPFVNIDFKNLSSTIKHHPACVRQDWIVIENDGTLVYNFTYLNANDITIKRCHYRAISWSTDDFTYKLADAVEFGHKQKIDLNEEFFHIQCSSTEHQYYDSAFARIFKPKSKQAVQKRTDRLPINVFMIGLDSVSRENWLTSLPGSSDYLINELGSIVLNGYNIVGDGTPAALIPVNLTYLFEQSNFFDQIKTCVCSKLLTAFHEHELPNTIKNTENVNHVDQVYPFVWKNFSQILNYSTLFNEDWPNVGKFTCFFFSYFVFTLYYQS